MMHEGAEDIVFRLLCCVVHCLVQDHFIGVHNGLFRVIAWWCILNCSVQVHIREEARRSNGQSVQVIVLCCTLFGS